MGFKLILISIFMTFSSAVKLECKYNLDVLYRYGCIVQNNGIFGNFQTEIDEIEFIHFSNKTNEQVKNLYIRKIPNVTFIPKYIDKFFEHLERIEITHSNLIEISKDDLKPFPKLKYLFLNDNDLKIIEEHLFEFNEHLEIIFLNNNKISHIAPFVFSNLKNLSLLNLSNNICNLENAYAFEKEEVKILRQKIENRDCFTLEETSEESANKDKQNLFSEALTARNVVIDNNKYERFKLFVTFSIIVTFLILIIAVTVAKNFILRQSLEAEDD
ncbi:hypothetical protein PVAND_015585 [Polypedilum vanderplanki]|uniref:Uncharacterized protein n=1 Tax=Polypedilum vanderplanki TaxID=319348 RepID=A0A9J6BD32_POLVA|nr:hypothetical protein PVAND_015585 [Polypedilum vanderplanki]